MKLTLPTDSTVRKEVPLYSGCYTYFPAALAGVAQHSKMGNDKHNPGQKLHHSRGKSADHADCIARHMMDLADMLAKWERGRATPTEGQAEILAEANALSWRALAWSQELHELFGAPLAPSARLPEDAYANVVRNTLEPFWKGCTMAGCRLEGPHNHVLGSIERDGKSRQAERSGSQKPVPTGSQYAREDVGYQTSKPEKAPTCGDVLQKPGSLLDHP